MMIYQPIKSSMYLDLASLSVISFYLGASVMGFYLGAPAISFYSLLTSLSSYCWNLVSSCWCETFSFYSNSFLNEATSSDSCFMVVEDLMPDLLLSWMVN